MIIGGMAFNDVDVDTDDACCCGAKEYAPCSRSEDAVSSNMHVVVDVAVTMLLDTVLC